MIIRRHIPPLTLSVLSLLLAVGGEKFSVMFRFERTSIAAGELWRLLTCHLMHLGWTHLLLNLTGLLLVWWIVGAAYSLRQWCWLIALIAPGIAGALYLFNPELSWYVGLSGLIYGMLASGLVGRFSHHPRESVIIGAVLAIKLLWEQQYGSITESFLTGPVVLDAHLYGALAGILSATVILFLRPNNTAVEQGD